MDGKQVGTAAGGFIGLVAFGGRGAAVGAALGAVAGAVLDNASSAGSDDNADTEN